MADTAKQRIYLPELDSPSFGQAVLTCETYKGGNGGLISAARITYVKDHCEAFALYGDFSKTLARYPGRATQKAIDAQQAFVFTPAQVESLKDEARAFYANKAKLSA